jgi:hypothetical protein
MTEERHEASNVVSQKTFFNLDCIDNPNQGGRKIDKYVSCHDVEHIYDYGSDFYTFGNYLASSEAKRCIGAVSQSPRRGLLRAGSKSLVMAVHSEQMILAGTKSAIPTVQLFGSLNWVMHSLGQSYQTHTTADQAQDSFKARWCVGLRFGSFLVTAILLILCLVSSSTVHGLEFWRGSSGFCRRRGWRRCPPWRGSRRSRFLLYALLVMSLPPTSACAATDFKAGANASTICAAKKTMCAAGFEFAVSSHSTADATCTTCPRTDFKAGVNADTTCMAMKTMCAAGFKFAASSDSTADATCCPNSDIYGNMFSAADGGPSVCFGNNDSNYVGSSDGDSSSLNPQDNLERCWVLASKSLNDDSDCNCLTAGVNGTTFGVDGSGDGFGGCDGSYIKDGGSGANEDWDGRSGDVGEFESFGGTGLRRLSGELNSGDAASVYRWHPALDSLTLPPCRKKGGNPLQNFHDGGTA